MPEKEKEKKKTEMEVDPDVDSITKQVEGLKVASERRRRLIILDLNKLLVYRVFNDLAKVPKEVRQEVKKMPYSPVGDHKQYRMWKRCVCI